MGETGSGSELEALEAITEIGTRSRVRLASIASRLAKRYGVDRDLVVTALLGQHPSVHRPEFDLPAVHYSRKSALLDQLGSVLLLDWTLVRWPEIRDLPVDGILGHFTADILLACKSMQEGAEDHLKSRRENLPEMGRLVMLALEGGAFHWHACWYAAEIRKRIDTEVAFFRSLR